MDFVFASKNIELTDAIKNYVIKKLGRLEKIYEILQAEIMISVEKYRHTADRMIFMQVLTYFMKILSASWKNLKAKKLKKEKKAR